MSRWRHIHLSPLRTTVLVKMELKSWIHFLPWCLWLKHMSPLFENPGRRKPVITAAGVPLVAITIRIRMGGIERLEWVVTHYSGRTKSNCWVRRIQNDSKMLILSDSENDHIPQKEVWLRNALGNRFIMFEVAEKCSCGNIWSYVFDGVFLNCRSWPISGFWNYIWKMKYF